MHVLMLLLLLLVVIISALCSHGVALPPRGVLGRTWGSLRIPILTRNLAGMLSLPLTEPLALMLVLCPEPGVMGGSGSRPSWAVGDLGSLGGACWGQHVIGVGGVMLHGSRSWRILRSQKRTCSPYQTTLVRKIAKESACLHAS